MNLSCTCKHWEENIAILNAPLNLESARNPRTYKGYQGKKFVYCPWCGEKLEDEKDIKVNRRKLSEKYQLGEDYDTQEAELVKLTGLELDKKEM